MQIDRRVSILLANIENMLTGVSAPELAPLSGEIEAMQSRLSQPLKVAIVGFMKAGKSTLMNAILKERVLYTGTVETTFTVSWFRYAEEKGLTLVMKDGSSFDAPFEDLKKWTVREYERENPAIRDVKYVILRYPNPILKTMELIDTPGLFSSYGADSRNTMEYMGLEAADKVTSEEASQADAILYAFSRGVHGKDAEVLDAFVSAEENSSPINAVGVFTRTDLFWDCGGSPETTPAQSVKEVISGYKQSPRLKNILYDILPVAAKLVESAALLTDAQWDALTCLSSIEEDILLDYLSDASAFCTEEIEELPVSPAERKELLQQITQYGIYTVVNAIRSGIGKNGLVDTLYEQSGVGQLSDVLLRHFGNRARLIKLNYILMRLSRVCNSLLHQYPDRTLVKKLCEQVIEEIEQVRLDEQAFRELEILRAYYNGDIAFPDEADGELLLRLTGEYGGSCEARLGVPEGTPVSRLCERAAALASYWNGIANDFSLPRRVCKAAGVLARSCETMHYHLDILSEC